MMKRAFRVSAIVISLLTAVSIMKACNSGKTESSSSKASSNASNPFVSSASEAESDTSKTSQASTSVSETSENDKQSSVSETTESSTQTSKPETQESSKETIAFNDILGQMNLIHKYKPFHSKTAEYTFFLSAWGTFSRIEYMLGHKTNLSKYSIHED